MGSYALRFGYGCHGNRKVTLQAGCNTLVYRLHCQTLRTGCYKYNPQWLQKDQLLYLYSASTVNYIYPHAKKMCGAPYVRDMCAAAVETFLQKKEKERIFLNQIQIVWRVRLAVPDFWNDSSLPS